MIKLSAKSVGTISKDVQVNAITKKISTQLSQKKKEIKKTKSSVA